MVFSFAHLDAGDVYGTRFEHGATRADGSRGRWLACTLSDTLQHCAVARARLLVAVRHGRHWHVLIPRNEDASARTWVLAESVRSLFMGGEAIDGARAAVRSATVG